MYCIARQCFLPARSREQAEVLLTKAALHSLADLFEAVPDPRGAHGLRSDLPFFLTCVAAALLCNCDGTEAVAQWCRDHHALLRRVFGPRLASRPPVVHCIDGFCHNEMPALASACWEGGSKPARRLPLRSRWRWMARPCGEPDRANRSLPIGFPSLPIIVRKRSGKCVWTRKPLRSRSPSRCCRRCPFESWVCTADALHTHAEFLRLMHELQAETVLTVKGNQPTLYADLATYFADPQARYLQAETVDRRRGRLQVRTIRVSNEMHAYLAPAWPFVAQVAQLTRTVTKAGQTTSEVVYLITTLSASKASPDRLLDKSRGHGSIENRSHSVREVSFKEDRSRLRKGLAPQILAAFRNLAITLIHRLGSSHIAATRCHFASCPHEALALLSQKRGGQH